MNREAMRKLGVKVYDTANHLRDDEEAKLYLLACVEEAGDDAAFIAKALGTVARSRVAMAEVAAKTGLSRESLYKALSGDRDPSFSTILKVSAALGLRLTFTSAVDDPAQAVEFGWHVTTTGNTPAGRPLVEVHAKTHSISVDLGCPALSNTNRYSGSQLLNASPAAPASINLAQTDTFASPDVGSHAGSTGAGTRGIEAYLGALDFGQIGMQATVGSSSAASPMGTRLLAFHLMQGSLPN